MNINIELLLAVNAFARSTPWLQPLMLLYSTVAGFVVFSELMLAGWWVGRRRSDLSRVAAAIWTPAGMLLALAINQPISKVLAEPRPYLLYPDLWTTSIHSLAPGFPSDHAVMAGAVTATLFLVSRSLGWVSLLAAVVMAFARVYVAEAYPFDVVVGLPMGAALSLISFVVVRRVLVRLLRMTDSTIFRPLVTATPRPPKPTRLPRPLPEPQPALTAPAPAPSVDKQLAEVEGEA